MKKLLLSAFAVAVAFAASAFNLAPSVTKAELGAKMDAKQAPKEMILKKVQKAFKQNAPAFKLNNPVTVASDFEGGYNWTYEMANTLGVDPDTVAGTEYTDPVVIFGADDTAGTVKIAGMFDGIITGTIDTQTYASQGYVALTLSEEDQVANTSNYGACTIKGIFYYEGDTQYAAGWYYTDVAAVTNGEVMVFLSDVWISRIIASGQYAGYSLTPYWKPGSYMEVNDSNNAVMEYAYNSFNYAAAMGITQENYVATVTNFAGLADNPVAITLQEGKTWTAEPTPLFTNTNGTFVLYGLPNDSTLDVLAGTGTENTLTFGTDWSGYDTETNYWLGQRGAATITLIGSEFIWPEAVAEPALYLIGSFNEWNEETQVPFVKDAAGNWTLTQEMAANAEFKMRDENGNWLGGITDGANFIVTQEQVANATALAISSPGMNFQIPVAGTWTLTVNPTDSTLVIAGEWVETVEPTTMYVLGEVNENGWAPNVGVEMVTEDNNVYTAEVNFDGRNEGYNYFSFTKVLAENADDWAAIAPYRIGAVSDGDFEVTDEYLNTELSLQAGEKAFKIPAGLYDLTLTKDAMTLVIAKVEPTLPVGDVTGDGKVDVADVNAVINIILKTKSQEDYPGKADVSGDDKVDVADVNAIINIILKVN